MTSPDTPEPSGEPAEAVLEASLQPRRTSTIGRYTRVAANLVMSVVSGGGEEALPESLDLVVVRRDTGAEILRVDAGPPEAAGYALTNTRRDLQTKTVEQFVREWRSVDD